MKHCPNCGQSRELGKLSIVQLAKDLLSSVFNFDNKVWLSLKRLFIPASLTKSFVAGKRVQLVNPVRFFLFFLLLHLASLAFLYSTLEKYIPNDTFIRKTEQIRLSLKVDSLANQPAIGIDSVQIDSLRKYLFDKDVLSTDTTSTQYFMINVMKGVLKEYKISQTDLALMDADQLVDKYQITNYLDKIKVHQLYKINENPRGVIRYFIGNLFWTIILLSVLTAIFMKLLYIRNHVYLTEHLVLSIHMHTFALLIGTLIALWLSTEVPIYNGDVELNAFYLLIPLVIYLVLSLKKYYQQSWLKTLIKAALIAGFYFFMLTTLSVLIGTISMLLY
jgi:hypothetical protein